MGLVCSGATAAAQTILDRRYTSAKLGEFWSGTLGTAPPDVARFELLAPDGPEPTVDPDAPPDFGLPFTGIVVGESGSGGGATRAFPVIPMSAEDAAVLMRRLAWAELYLSRFRDYEPISTDGADVIGALTSHHHAAALEAYLIAARLYFAAPDLTGKCRRLSRMSELRQGALASLDEAAPPPDWQPLVAIAVSVDERLSDSALASLVCTVDPVRGRGETIERVESRVRGRIMQEVRAKVDDTLTLLEAASSDFQTLVNEMDVPIPSAEILELERVLGNAAANMVLVKEDQLDAAETISTLQAVDLSSLDQPTELDDFEAASARMETMTARIDEVLTSLAALPERISDPEISEALAICATLAGAYPALDLTRDTGTLTQQIQGPYTACLTRARAVADRFQEPSLETALMAELARHVRQISETYLSAVTP